MLLFIAFSHWRPLVLVFLATLSFFFFLFFFFSMASWINKLGRFAQQTLILPPEPSCVSVFFYANQCLIWSRNVCLSPSVCLSVWSSLCLHRQKVPSLSLFLFLCGTASAGKRLPQLIASLWTKFNSVCVINGISVPWSPLLLVPLEQD